MQRRSIHVKQGESCSWLGKGIILEGSDERRFLFSRSAGAAKRRTVTFSIHLTQKVPRGCPGGEASAVLTVCSWDSRQCNNPGSLCGGLDILSVLDYNLTR